MNTLKKIILGLTILLFPLHFTYAQINLKKLKDKAKEKAKKKFEKKKKELKDKAKDNVLTGLKNAQESYDSTNFNFAISLSDNAGMYENKEKFKKYSGAVLSIAKNSDGLKGLAKQQDKLQQAKTSNNSAEMLYVNSKFKLAKALFKKAQVICEKNGYKNDFTYAKIIANQGLLFHTIGNYEDAEACSLQGLKLKGSIVGKETYAYASSLNNLAMLYKDLGRYNESEKLINQAISLVAMTSGKESSAYAIVLNNKAMLFQKIGRFKEAIALLKQSLEAGDKSKNMREKSTTYQKISVNLGLLYQELAKRSEKQEEKNQHYNNAEDIYLKAINRKEKQWKGAHPDLAYMKTHLASLYMQMGKKDKVESNLLEALEIYNKKFGIDNISYALPLRYLGTFYRANGALDKAEAKLKKALEIYKKILNPNHPNYHVTQKELALLYWQKGNIAVAKKYFKEVMSRTLIFIKQYFPPMSESEKEKYWDEIHYDFLEFYAFAVQNQSKYPELLTEMYDYHLLTKGILLNSSNKIKQQILASNNTSLKADYKKWITQKEEIIKYYAYSKEELDEQGIDIRAMEASANALEKKLSENSMFKKGYEEKPLTYADVQNVLVTDEVLLDIVHLYKFDKGLTKDVIYAALVVEKGKATPSLVLLDNGNDLEGKYFKYYRNMIKAKRTDKYTYKMYWEKIAPKIASKKIVYLSLDGIYNQISLNTIQATDGKYLLEKNNFIFLTNTAELKRFKTKKKNYTNKEFVFVGNPYYGSQGLVSALPGTKKEIEAVATLAKQKGYIPQTISEHQATEETIKKVRSPRVLHIATHGFFIEDIKNKDKKVFGVSPEVAESDPMLRSGLLLANAEGAMQENKKQKTDNIANNGILTALEASNMQLENTEIVIMSACETGLGDIKAGEGVYGLQRAFFIAGADAIIMSMWTVSDAATQKLMTLFYQYWLTSKNKEQAFKKAQLALKKQFPQPYYWGAFVLISD